MGVRWVYPRPRGGTRLRGTLYSRQIGLSPPTRGNPVSVAMPGRADRSIPAHAGEPSASPLPQASASVYPRPRGGTAAVERLAESPLGLSPPTRGNPAIRREQRELVGSIPAHAGEPPHTRRRLRLCRVYPRPRGGTLAAVSAQHPRPGLSPPTRGNRRAVRAGGGFSRSIPAHAGEPTDTSILCADTPVYPRPRGGTMGTPRISAARVGLSPPTRGNQLTDPALFEIAGSIPAHAGEPAAAPAHPAPRRVYPRPRGGTSSSTWGRVMAMGLSPPTRGNPSRRRRPNRNQRSIPAHAGEPGVPNSTILSRSVYPRPRGGTVSVALDVVDRLGLSPPTRGNLAGTRQGLSLIRSIPAHAGEP